VGRPLVLGQRSCVDVNQRFAMLYTLRKDGKVASAQLFSGVAAAQSAAEAADHVSP
jgi:hypothetical protein